MSGQAGSWAAPVRGLLGAAAFVYAFAVNRRNRSYDDAVNVCKVDAPVISVGNVTVGGTGKTPMVIHIASRLEQLGFSPAVVARGYGVAHGTANDEERLIRARVPGIAYEADSDRVGGAERAIHRQGADVIVLDDGFQHRRLARALDVVLVDATLPFGFDHLLPRGLLREPVRSLGRADLVVLTRCDQVSRDALDRVVDRLRGISEDLPVIQCRHAVTRIERLDGTACTESLDGKRVIAFAGIAQPRGFLTTLRSLGCDVVGTRWWPDHYNYRARDLDELCRAGRFPEFEALVTTEKDAVKLRAIGGPCHSNLLMVCVDIDFMDDGGTILDEFLVRAVGSKRPPVGSENASL